MKRFALALILAATSLTGCVVPARAVYHGPGVSVDYSASYSRPYPTTYVDYDARPVHVTYSSPRRAHHAPPPPRRSYRAPAPRPVYRESCQPAPRQHYRGHGGRRGARVSVSW